MKHKKLLEKVMQMILKGKSDVLHKLRKQYQIAKKTEEISDVGFYINFELNDEKYLVDNKSFHIGDVYGTVKDQYAVVGFILFVKEGKIQMLEAYTNGIDKFPKDDEIILTYDNGKKERDESILEF